MKDRGIKASYLLSPQSKVTNPEKTNQFKVVKDPNSNRGNDSQWHNTIPVTFCDNLLTFGNTGKIFELKGDLSKMITNKNFIVGHASFFG